MTNSESFFSDASLDLDRIYRHNWFKLYLPTKLGGKAWSLPEGIRLLHELACEDGNLAWVVNLGSGANYFYPMLKLELAKEVYGPEQAVVAGNGTPTGKLRALGEGGYQLSGRWEWCTGADWATVFTVSVRCLDVQGRDTGKQAAVVLLPDQVKLYRKWTAMGLRHSASYTIEADQVHVPEERRFSLEKHQHDPGLPFYHFPFIAMARLSFAACVLGMGEHFCKLGGGFLEEKARQSGRRLPAPFHQWERSKEDLERTRQDFFKTLDSAWAEQLESGSISEATSKTLDEQCFSTVEIALSASDGLFPWLGMAAVDTEHPINRVWRDLHTGAQHALLKRL